MADPINFSYAGIDYQGVYDDTLTPIQWRIYRMGDTEIRYGLFLPSDTTAAELITKLQELITVQIPPAHIPTPIPSS